jgi:hypothetical protein
MANNQALQTILLLSPITSIVLLMSLWDEIDGQVLLSIQWAGWRSRFPLLGPLFGDGVLPQPANLITVGEMTTVNKIFH